MGKNTAYSRKKGMRRPYNHAEFDLQCQVAEYIQIRYPGVQFLSDTVASVKLTMPQAIRNKKIQKAGFKCMDLLILEPRGIYHGLFIELKVDTPFRKDGKLKSGDHLKGQQKSISDMNNKGYKALFSWGFEMTRKIIDDYMGLPKNY